MWQLGDIAWFWLKDIFFHPRLKAFCRPILLVCPLLKKLLNLSLHFYSLKRKIMKHYILLSAAISIFAMSCKKADPGPIALSITKADFATNYKPGGASYNNATINIAATPVTAPVAGENQNWDVSGLTIASSIVLGPFVAPTNAAYPSATFGSNVTAKFGFGSLSSAGTPGVQYYELSNDGWYNLGTSTSATDVLTIAAIGGTLTFAPQNIGAGSAKYPLINLPASFGSQSTAGNIVDNSNFIANAPAVGVVNTPGQSRRTDSVSNNIFASGTLSLKGIGKVRVLVNKQTQVQKINYFLGGAPAPAALLTTLGLTDGASTTTISYNFYAEGLGNVGRISCDASGTTVKSATFRTQ